MLNHQAKIETRGACIKEKYGKIKGIRARPKSQQIVSINRQKGQPQQGPLRGKANKGKTSTHRHQAQHKRARAKDKEVEIG